MTGSRQVGFRYEAEMSGPVEAWLASQGLGVKREYQTPWGICDLVGCQLNEGKVVRRLQSGQRKPIGPLLRISLLLQIPEVTEGRCITLQKLTREYGPFVGEARVEEEIRHLLSRRFVDSPRRSHFRRRVGDWMPLHDRIIAVELKLSRVEEALRQAVSHLEFADESYVALPMECGKRAVSGSKRLEFEASSVGVLGLAGRRAEVLLAAKPRRNDPPQPVQAHCAERFWRTAVTGS